MRKAEAAVKTEEGLHVLQLACVQVVHTPGLTHAACSVVQPEAEDMVDEQVLYVVTVEPLHVQHVSMTVPPPD